MPQVTIPDIIILISPPIIAALSGWIGQSHWPAWANALVAGLIIVVSAVLCVLAGGGRFSNDLALDFFLVAAYMAALMYGPFRPLQKYLILGAVSQQPAIRLTPPSAPAVSPSSTNEQASE